MLEDRSATETADRHSSAANSSRLVAAGQAFGVLILAMAMNAIAADAAAQGRQGFLHAARPGARQGSRVGRALGQIVSIPGHLMPRDGDVNLP